MAEEYQENSGFLDQGEELDALLGLGGLEDVGYLVAYFVSHRLGVVMRGGSAVASKFLLECYSAPGGMITDGGTARKDQSGF